jgi:hypothetical protein
MADAARGLGQSELLDGAKRLHIEPNGLVAVGLG